MTEDSLVKRRTRNRDKSIYRNFLGLDLVSLFVYFWLVVAQALKPQWYLAALAFGGLMAFAAVFIWLMKGEPDHLPVRPVSPTPDDSEDRGSS